MAEAEARGLGMGRQERRDGIGGVDRRGKVRAVWRGGRLDWRRAARLGGSGERRTMRRGRE